MNPIVVNSPRVDQLIHDNKLQITLQDAVELALENSLDIAVARYNPWIADTDILRTKAGGQGRGVPGADFRTSLASITPTIRFSPTIPSSPPPRPWIRARLRSTILSWREPVSVVETHCAACTLTPTFLTSDTTGLHFRHHRKYRLGQHPFLVRLDRELFQSLVQSSLTAGFSANSC